MSSELGSSDDLRFIIINSDGTEPEMCGNGMRCFARFVYENRILTREKMQIETKAGTVVPELSLNDQGEVASVCVDVGQPILEPVRVPFVCDRNPALEEPLVTTQGEVRVTAVSMGNPHAVIFVDDIDSVDLAAQGRAVEIHERFPEKVNAEFVQVLSDSELRMRVWERGAGITLACGTGACASLVAAHLTGRTQNRALIHLDGGDLSIFWDRASNHVFKTGPASLSFKGRVSI